MEAFFAVVGGRRQHGHRALLVQKRPRLVDELMDGHLDIESLVSARRPLEDAAAALDDLATGHALRQLLIP